MGSVLEELGLPLVEHRGMDLVFVAELGDGCSVDQMASKDGHFLIRQVLISGLGHDEKLMSNYSLFEKDFSPLSLVAKHLLMHNTIEFIRTGIRLVLWITHHRTHQPTMREKGEFQPRLTGLNVSDFLVQTLR